MATLHHNACFMQEISIHHYCNNTTPFLAQNLWHFRVLCFFFFFFLLWMMFSGTWPLLSSFLSTILLINEAEKKKRPSQLTTPCPLSNVRRNMFSYTFRQKFKFVLSHIYFIYNIQMEHLKANVMSKLLCIYIYKWMYVYMFHHSSGTPGAISTKLGTYMTIYIYIYIYIYYIFLYNLYIFI
jgi:hypothetical protein